MTPGIILTLGKFDGLHLGHRSIVGRLLDRARETDHRSVALVLHPHPARVLHGRAIPLLTSLEDRLAGLRRWGVDRAELLPFDLELAALDPQDFVTRLHAAWGISGLVVGDDFAFGRERSGDARLLGILGAAMGFSVDVVPGLEEDGNRVSSQGIRSLVAAGQVAAAAAAIGRPFSLLGEVVHGAKRGRQLGYPTANLALVDDYVVPGRGVYAVWARPESHDLGRGQVASPWIMGAANIGNRPQFDDGATSIEVHLLDHDSDLYGRRLRLAFMARLRDEARFPSVEALVTQIDLDVGHARRRLSDLGPPRPQG